VTTPDASGRASGDDRRLLETLQRVLAIQELDLRGALTQASNRIAEALRADKVDIFLYVAEGETLVALGTSATEVGRRQHRIGMERQPIANGGVVVRAFQSGEPYETGHADQDPDQLPGMNDALGVRSEINVPVDVNGERRGVLSAISLQPEFFTEADLAFLQAVASWIGTVAHRAELFERATREATRRGRRDAAEELAKLTRRQQEVAVCIAEGLSNAVISQRLVITEGTVANHIEHMLRRLGLTSRTQIAVWAVERGLYRSDQEEAADEPSDRSRWRGRSVGGRSDAERTDDRAAGGDDGPGA
jgi:DNA-binding CsgD family transcriptional regulator/putative methionine-R-sulfoxide reductase with GAF domain